MSALELFTKNMLCQWADKKTAQKESGRRRSRRTVGNLRVDAFPVLRVARVFRAFVEVVAIVDRAIALAACADVRVCARVVVIAHIAILGLSVHAYAIGLIAHVQRARVAVVAVGRLANTHALDADVIFGAQVPVIARRFLSWDEEASGLGVTTVVCARITVIARNRLASARDTFTDITDRTGITVVAVEPVDSREVALADRRVAGIVRTGIAV